MLDAGVFRGEVFLNSVFIVLEGIFNFCSAKPCIAVVWLQWLCIYHAFTKRGWVMILSYGASLPLVRVEGLNICICIDKRTHTELYNSWSGGLRIWKGKMGRHRRNNVAAATFWFMYLEGGDWGGKGWSTMNGFEHVCFVSGFLSLT